jgi:hypothetical protein
MPGRTNAGNLSLRKMPKGERAALYTQAVRGRALVTVKEALAVAPGIQAVRLVAPRQTGTDAYGDALVECILAARWSRRALDGVAWASADAATVAQNTADPRQARGGKELRPMDLGAYPEIGAVLKVVDIEELTA